MGFMVTVEMFPFLLLLQNRINLSHAVSRMITSSIMLTSLFLMVKNRLTIPAFLNSKENVDPNICRMLDKIRLYTGIMGEKNKEK